MNKVEPELLERNLERQISGYQTTALIYAAVKLGLVEALEHDSADLETIASSIDCQPRELERLLRALVLIGICERTAQGIYKLSDSGLLLTTSSPTVHREMVEIAVEQYLQSWANLCYSVRTGKSVFEHLHGMKPFEWRKNHDEASKSFNKWLAKETNSTVHSIVKALHLDDVKMIADIGGGCGNLLAAILEHHPLAHGTLFEQAHVLAQAKSYFQESDPVLLARTKFAEGDFFHPINIDADAYVLKSIIHDWDDKDALKILKNCRATMTRDSKLILIERLIDKQSDNMETTTLLDLHMMVMTGSRERSLNDCKELLTASRFTLLKCSPTGSGHFLLEATPA